MLNRAETSACPLRPGKSRLQRGSHAGRMLGLVALVLLAPWALFAAEAETRDPRAYFFAQTFGDLPEELAEARQGGKQGLLLFFEQEGCPYCERMMKNVLNRPEVQDWYGEHFTSIAVDINGSVELRDVDGVTLPSKAFAEHRRIRTTPVMSFIALDGTEVFRRSTAVNSVEEFLQMGRYVADGRYTDTAWRDYREEQGGASHRGGLIPIVSDFAAEAQRLAGEDPVVLLAVTREGCPYCARLRAEVLAPMLRSGEHDRRLLIREMMMEPDTPATDFSGQATSTARLAEALGVSIAPTVLLLDEGGRRLADPLVGINSADMYNYYLDQAIAEALAVRDAQRE